MQHIIDGIYLGGDESVAKAKELGYARLCCCKDGPDSHRSMLGYTTLGAPKGKNYLYAREGNVLALNLIDVEDPTMIQDECIDEGLRFIKEMQDKQLKLLVHCNAGMSRSPSIVLAYLRAADGLPDSFVAAKKRFKAIYHKYDPSVGIDAHVRERWKDLPNFFSGGKNAVAK
jgi:hypothetical protein